MPHTATPSRWLKIGSLFSGYGGLDLAVEHHFDAEPVWLSEFTAPVARVFTEHWPALANLGDISTVSCGEVVPVDILAGAFRVRTCRRSGKQAVLAPGTRSGLWSFMAQTIGALQPRYVVIANVRGLLSARAVRPETQGATLMNATPSPEPMHPRPLQSGTRPMGSGRPASSTPSGTRRDTRRSVRPWAPCAMDRPTGFRIGAPHYRIRIFILGARRAW